MLESLLRIIALTRKELLAILKDPRSRMSLLLPPILQCLIFGYAATYDLNRVPYALIDNDHSAASAELIARLNGTGVFYCVQQTHRVEDLRQAIDNRDALLTIQFDADFERHLLNNQPAAVQLIADGRNSNTAATAMYYVATIVDRFNADWRSSHPAVSGGSAGTPADPVAIAFNPTGDSTAPAATAPSAPPVPRAVQVSVRAWFNPNLETRWNMIPALIGTLTMLQTLLLTAMSVAREREQGTFDQLLVTPFRPAEIMIGKTLPSMLVGIVQATNVLLVAQLWFRIPFAGSFITLYTGLILFLLAAVGIGLLLSAISATMQQAMLYSFLVMMPFMLLSGLTTPISGMPMVLQHFTRINPLRYAIDIAQRVYLEGTGLSHLGADLIPLAIIAAITLPTAAWLFRHRME